MARLGDVCDVRDGTHDSPSYVEEGYPLVTSKNIIDGKLDLSVVSYISFEDYRKINERSKVDSGDIIMPMIGTIGNPYIVEEFTDFAIKNVALIKFTNKRVFNKYIFYFLNSGKFRRYIYENNRGGTQKFLSLKDIRNIEIEFPTLDKQVEIVTKLNKVSNLICLRKQQLTKLDELVKARFVEMFGMVGTDEKGWGLIRLGDVCNINPKKVYEPRLKPGLQVSFVPMPAVSEKGEIDPSETKNYDEVKSGFTYFREDDVLFAKITPCMENGKGAVAKGLCNGIGFGSTEFHVLRPIENISNPYWLYTVTSFNQFRIDAASNMTGSAGQRRVPASFLESYRISVPPIELQNQFAAFVEQVDKSKVAVQKALDEAQTLFDSLMQQYFG